MKKLLLMVMVGFMLVGCAGMQYLPATSGRVQRLETRVARIDGYTRGLGVRVEKLETGLEDTDSQVAQLNAKVSHYADLSAYTNMRVKKIRKIVAEREARSIYASNAGEVQVYFLGPFTTGSSLVSPKLERQLKKLIDSLKKHRLQIAEVDGFASSDGSAARNSELSRLRALAIADWLKARKVKVNKVRGLGGVDRFGEARDNRSVIVFARKAPAPVKKVVPAPAVKKALPAPTSKQIQAPTSVSTK